MSTTIIKEMAMGKCGKKVKKGGGGREGREAKLLFGRGVQ